MTITIYKYTLQLKDHQTISMPASRRILSVGLDPRGELCVWAFVDRENTENKNIDFYIIGTGHDIRRELLNDTFKHLGTVTQGMYVWHVFYDTRTA